MLYKNRTQPFPKQALLFTCLQYKSFENTVGKGEIARDEQFLLFQHCFLPVNEELSAGFFKFEIVICKLFQFGRVKILSLGKVLMHSQKVSTQVILHRLHRLTSAKIFCFQSNSCVSEGYTTSLFTWFYLLTLSQTTNFRLFQTERVCRHF